MKLIYVFLVTAFLTSSCANLYGPEDFEEEIQDAVQYYVSLSNLVIETRNDGANAALFIGRLAEIGMQSQLTFLDSLESQILTLYESKSEYSYRDAIVDISKWRGSENKLKYSKAANELLKIYDATTVSITDYQLVKSSTKKKTWQFKELNTDIIFTFELIDCDKENMTYFISPLDNSWQRYFESQL